MKRMTIITCSSFTVIMLLFALFTAIGLEDIAPEITRSTTIQVFSMSFTIAALMGIYDKIMERTESFSFLADVIIRILICYIVVFTEGCLVGMFTFSWKSLLDITPVMIPVFVITYLVSYLSCIEYAQQINKSIRDKKL